MVKRNLFPEVERKTTHTKWCSLPCCYRLFYFCKNMFYKNMEAHICEILSLIFLKVVKPEAEILNRIYFFVC